MGMGSSLVAAAKLNRRSIGFEINKDFIKIRYSRLQKYNCQFKIIDDSCLNIENYILVNSIDFCITSPPYWNILNRKRSADCKKIRNYGNEKRDLSNIKSYDKFLTQIQKVFSKIYILQELSHANIINFGFKKHKLCNPKNKVIRKRKPINTDEHSSNLPVKIRGIHFNAFWEICRALGCKMGN